MEFYKPKQNVLNLILRYKKDKNESNIYYPVLQKKISRKMYRLIDHKLLSHNKRFDNSIIKCEKDSDGETQINEMSSISCETLTH